MMPLDQEARAGLVGGASASRFVTPVAPGA